MEFVTHNHRFAINIIESNKALFSLWNELLESISEISDTHLKEGFTAGSNKMSLSDSINDALDKELTSRGWVPQSAIFQGSEYSDKKWRLDFSKKIEDETHGITGMAVEVAFNHGEAIAWNLLKPVLAAEISPVKLETEIGTGVGVYICATQELKKAGAFDSAVGEYEKVLRYLNPLSSKLTTPLVILGLKAPKSFRVVKERDKSSGRNIGRIVKVV